MSLKIVLLGAPGAGKGTQARLIMERYGIPMLSTGEMLRAAVAAKTEVGLKAKSYMDSGGLVPDEVVNNIVKEYLQKHGAKGFLLDGYPRNLLQAKALAGFTKIDAVVFIALSVEEVKRRLSGRRSCLKCGASYNVYMDGERKTCKCGAELVRREDDREEAVEQRIKNYLAQTEPLVDFYTKSKLLKEVNGVGGIKEVSQRIFDVLDREGRHA
jgi:adenylate kinase